MLPIKVKRLRPNAVLPVYASTQAAGADLCACLDEPVTIDPGKTVYIPTGLAMEIPIGCAGLIYARSGLSCKQGLAPANKVGVIDSDYRGEFIVALHNHGMESQTVSGGDRIAQLLITSVLTPGFFEGETLSETERDSKGFGSTGK